MIPKKNVHDYLKGTERHFSSSSLCETGFSSLLKHLKIHNRLNEEADIKIKLSTVVRA
jgi:hypothetical protein